jgi:hypothetical protein
MSSSNYASAMMQAMSLIMLSRSTVAAMEEPDLYPVEDGLQMALDKLYPLYESLSNGEEVSNG